MESHAEAAQTYLQQITKTTKVSFQDSIGKLDHIIQIVRSDTKSEITLDDAVTQIKAVVVELKKKIIGAAGPFKGALGLS